MSQCGHCTITVPTNNQTKQKERQKKTAALSGDWTVLQCPSCGVALMRNQRADYWFICKHVTENRRKCQSARNKALFYDAPFEQMSKIATTIRVGTIQRKGEASTHPTLVARQRGVQFKIWKNPRRCRLVRHKL